MDGGARAMDGFDPTDDARAFRDALGSFATGVTVVTAGTPAGPVGITANSFASVSLDPPLVLWSPAKASSRYAIFRDAARFSIHVMGAHQQAVCDGFTRDRAAFGGLAWRWDDRGVPVIEDCLARFDCTRAALHDAGDHAIVVGRVTRAAHRGGLPLLFQGGRFIGLKG